jgi:hypothetical protein
MWCRRSYRPSCVRTNLRAPILFNPNTFGRILIKPNTFGRWPTKLQARVEFVCVWDMGGGQTIVNRNRLGTHHTGFACDFS